MNNFIRPASVSEIISIINNLEIYIPKVICKIAAAYVGQLYFLTANNEIVSCLPKHVYYSNREIMIQILDYLESDKCTDATKYFIFNPLDPSTPLESGYENFYRVF